MDFTGNSVELNNSNILPTPRNCNIYIYSILDAFTYSHAGITLYNDTSISKTCHAELISASLQQEILRSNIIKILNNSKIYVRFAHLIFRFFRMTYFFIIKKLQDKKLIKEQLTDEEKELKEKHPEQLPYSIEDNEGSLDALDYQALMNSTIVQNIKTKAASNEFTLYSLKSTNQN